MVNPGEEIIVGVMGQWGSGKSTASAALVEHLGGPDQVVFITDRELLARQAVDYIKGLDETKARRIITPGGTIKLEGDLAAVFLREGEALDTVDLNTLLFDLHDEVYDGVPVGGYSWLDLARLELGSLILEHSGGGKPIVIEAGFGTNTDPKGENPYSHTISDLFARLVEAGVSPKRVKWIIIEASYETRAGRNRRRLDTVPAVEFDRFAADGGDLEPDQERELVENGMVIRRVPNNHDDINRFRADIIQAYEDMFG